MAILLLIEDEPGIRLTLTDRLTAEGHTADLSRKHALHLSYWTDGDTRNRGRAILRFKQAFGRLIRSREDRGIVVVLDKRLLTKKYGQQFLAAAAAHRLVGLLDEWTPVIEGSELPTASSSASGVRASALRH